MREFKYYRITDVKKIRDRESDKKAYCIQVSNSQDNQESL